MGLALPKILSIPEGLPSGPTYPPDPLVLLGGHDRPQDWAFSWVCAEWGCPLLAPSIGADGPGEQGPGGQGKILGGFSREAYRSGSWLPKPAAGLDSASEGSTQRGGSIMSQGRVMTLDKALRVSVSLKSCQLVQRL